MEAWWPLRLPMRILAAAELLLLPLRAVSMAAELVLAIVAVAALATGFALYEKLIPDAQVEAVLAEAGRHTLTILRHQGLY